MSFIEVKGISKSYTRNAPVLRSVSFSIEKGEMYFLLGPSGCGKSTLLRIIAGLLEPDSGKIMVDGTDITDMPSEKRNTPMVFQSYALWPHMDVYENIAFGLRIRKFSSAEIDRRVKEILATVELEECIHRKIGSLSGGQQQRVSLARALASDPRLILLDEPLSNLDARLRDYMRYEIRDICKRRGVTALYVTHDRHEVLSIADRVLLLDNGEIQQIGTPRELFHMPASIFAASFLGDANFIPAKIKISTETEFTFETELGELRTVRLPRYGTLASDTGLKLMFRPGNAVINPCENFTGNRFEAFLSDISFFGECTQYRFKKNTQEILVNSYNAPELDKGTSHILGLRPEDIVVLER